MFDYVLLIFVLRLYNTFAKESVSNGNYDPDESESNHASASSPGASGSSQGLKPSGSSQEGDDTMWLCPTCNKPPRSQDMICCDSCDEWVHFECVGIALAPPARQKWYCSVCAP